MKPENRIKLLSGKYPNNGNDPENPNGMKLYKYRGERIAAYSAKDVPLRYKYLFKK